MKKTTLCLLLFGVLLASGKHAQAQGRLPAPNGLMVNLLANPAQTEITSRHPQFSWIVRSNEKNDVQRSYELRVAASEQTLMTPERCLWNTGPVPSDQSLAVTYVGRPLEPAHSYWWTVKIRNRRGTESAWAAPQEFRTGALPDPAGAAVDRYPIVQTEVTPIRVVQLDAGHCFADFGRSAFAGLKLTLNAPRSGLTLTVHLGERLDTPNHIHRNPGGSLRYQRSEIPLQAGTHTYTVPLGSKDGRRMATEIGPVMPYRYVEVENAPALLDKSAFRQLAAHYPFDEKAAAFSSSDPRLNAVWELCRYSIEATSCFGVYVDGDRERLPYEADAYINQLGHYSSDREFTLARYSLETLILQPTWPTEWSLHIPLMAWADYLYTGDPGCIAAFYEDIKAKSLIALAREDGLISTTTPPPTPEILATLHAEKLQLRDIVDWPQGERDGYDFQPINTVVNAFHYRALTLTAQIAEALHKEEDARRFTEQAAKVAEAFNAKLFDPQTGLYLDGEGSRHSSLHANMLALAFGLVPPERKAAVAAFVRSKGMACSVYGAQYLMEALYRSGQADQALQLMLAPGDRSWRHMVEEVGTTITSEAWDSKYKPNQDWNHAWGAAPANIIPRLLMGIEPTAPGFHKMHIQPQPGGLARASLDLPTISGTVHLDFVNTPQRLTLHLNLPANTTADILVPRRGREDTHVTLDGAARYGVIEGDFILIASVGSGSHTLER